MVVQAVVASMCSGLVWSGVVWSGSKLGSVSFLSKWNDNIPCNTCQSQGDWGGLGGQLNPGPRSRFRRARRARRNEGTNRSGIFRPKPTVYTIGSLAPLSKEGLMMSLWAPDQTPTLGRMLNVG